ncbi:multiubiquitin domain-containing protein [Sphingomonas sp.]|uniref:multiubiquitin domain-containing protein n=1 Tax=Sphingomonas sp. TaxID=28214 RepID=UPI003F6F586D
MTDQAKKGDGDRDSDVQAGKERDPGVRYVIHIDKKEYELSDPTPTGAQLLRLAGKTPVDQFAIYLRQAGQQPRRIPLKEHVDLRTHGVERFVTLPLDQTEGQDAA